MIKLRHLPPLLALAVAAIPILSCQRVYPTRTLPSWVRGVYIPMIQNQSTEPGLEEIATRLTQEEFLADGRVQVAPKRTADLQLVAVIKSYKTRADHFGSLGNDRIPDRKDIEMETELMLYDPEVDPFTPGDAVASLGTILTRTSANADPRSTGYTLEPDSKELALQILARQIVFRTITGFPAKLKDTPTGSALPQDKSQEPGETGNIMRNRRGLR